MRGPATRRSAHTSRGMRRVVAAVVAIGIASVVTLASCGPPDTKPVRVVVPRGASFRAAAESLGSRGVIRSPFLFRSYALWKERDRAIKPGTYVLRPGTSYAALVDALVNGRGLVHVMIVVEGWELRQIVPQLARSLEVPRDSVEAAVRDTALLHRLDIPTSTLEGYLFPATYTYPPGTSAREAIARMVARFEQAWQPAWNERLQALALTRHDAVTLASIVEREAIRPEERPVIAAVYYNRLRRGMRLEADPTIQYALGRHTARVLYRDLEIDSPYNTYRHSGLPPGPIGSPGAPSLAAAVMPAQVPYLYFVAQPDGHHEFRTTYAEHLQAVREARVLGRPLDPVANRSASNTPATSAPHRGGARR